MEKRCPDIIDVAFQREQAPFLFIVPDFYIAVITARYKQWQLRVEVDTAHSPVVLLELEAEILRIWRG